MRKGSKTAQFQAPLMSAFREAFETHDAKQTSVKVVDGERVIEGRSSRQRRGDEAALKRDLSVDLVSLLNTINLGSVVDLHELDYVGKSVLNYGLPDIAHLTSEDIGVDDIRDQLIDALRTYEPRIISDSLRVQKDVHYNDVEHRVRFAVSCEMHCAPVDVAVDFVAELEVSSGKVSLTRLPVAS
jgi:type VI secretion system protein ImpF